jgi:hypothetical protein
MYLHVNVDYYIIVKRFEKNCSIKTKFDKAIGKGT